MKDVAIVTAIAGGYDTPRPQPVDFIFYNDSNLPHPELDPRRRAKAPKLWPEQFSELKQYRYCIWIDGTMQIINAGFVEEILSYLKNGLVLSPHFNNLNCAYKEAKYSLDPKYAEEPLAAQTNFYRQEGFPENYGLYECGVMARDMHNPQVEAVGKLWYEQNLQWSFQDQVSLPYVLWKTGFQPDVLPKSWRDFGWINLGIHNY